MQVGRCFCYNKAYKLIGRLCRRVMCNTVAKIAKQRFDNQLNSLCNRCNVKARFMLPREFAMREVKANQIKKQKAEHGQEKAKQIPLIGKLISKHL